MIPLPLSVPLPLLLSPQTALAVVIGVLLVAIFAGRWLLWRPPEQVKDRDGVGYGRGRARWWRRRLSRRDFAALAARGSETMVLVDPESGDVVLATAAAAAQGFFRGLPIRDAFPGTAPADIEPLITPETLPCEIRLPIGAGEPVPVRAALVDLPAGPLIQLRWGIEAEGKRGETTMVMHGPNGETGEHPQFGAGPDDGASRLSGTSQLHKALSVRANFLANMTHELRTPLSVILGGTRFLKDPRSGNLTSDQRETVVDIDQAAEELSALITDILDLTRVETDALNPRNELCDLSEIANAAIAGVRANGRYVDVDIVTDIDPVVALCDGPLMRKTVERLLARALFATQDAASPLIRVALKQTEMRGTSFAIEDNGAGIPTEDRAILFEPFAVAESAYEKRASTSVMLPLCAAIVRRLGSELVYEPLRAGSRFSFVIKGVRGAVESVFGMSREDLERQANRPSSSDTALKRYDGDAK